MEVEILVELFADDGIVRVKVFVGGLVVFIVVVAMGDTLLVWAHLSLGALLLEDLFHRLLDMSHFSQKTP